LSVDPPTKGGSPRSGDWRPRRLFGRLRGSSVARPPLGDSGGVLAAPVAVAGDVILSAEAATSDLSSASAARLGGRAIAMAGLVVVGGVVLSRVLGWGRNSVFSAEFGTSPSLDAFFAAFRIPDALFQLVAAGAVGSALVPVASELLARGEPERARKLVSTIANLMILTLIPLTVAVWLLAPSVMGLIDSKADPSQLQMDIGLTRLMLLSPLLLALGAVMTAGLNAAGIFGAPALAPNVYNIAIIVCALALTPFLGIYALALGVVVGAAGHLLTQAPAVRRTGLYRPSLDIHDPAVRQTLTLMAPRALGLGATQIVFLVNTFFAYGLGGGALSSYTLAFTALQIPVGLIGVPLGIVLLPPLSQAIARGDDARFRSLVDQALRLLLFAVVPLTCLMFALATPTLAFLYQYGAFTQANRDSMTPVYTVFLFGLVAHVLIALLAPIFYAGKDTRTPVTAALLAVAVDVVAAAVLFPLMHLEGLALAIGLGAWVEVLVLMALMERRIGFDLRPMARHSMAFVGGGVVAAAAAYLADRLIEQYTGGPITFFARVAELVPAGLVGLAVYVVWARACRLPELDAALALARTLAGRGRRARSKPVRD
jgi:putative peptidoglycan lipid II flippase